MTISSQTRKAGPFTGDDVTVDLPFAFKVFAAADLLVVSRNTTTDVETTLALTTDYTVTLNSNQNANPGGTVTLTSALATGHTAIVTSAIDYLQTADLTNQGGFYPKVITDALDRITILCQQLKEEVDRSAKVPITSEADAATLVDNINNLAAQFGGITTVAVPYQVFDGDGATTDFTLSSAPGSLAAVEVYVGGSNKVPGTDYTLNGTTLSFTVAPALGTGNIFVRWISALATTTIEDGSVSTAKLAASAVSTAKIAASAVTTSRLADGAVTSIKLDPTGVVLPTGSTVYVPDLTDDSAKPAPTQWVKDLTATDARAGLIAKSTTAKVQTGIDTDTAMTPDNLRQGAVVTVAEAATTSGTTKDIGSIPSWVKHIRVHFKELSTNGTSAILVQLTDSGGPETTNYVGCGVTIGATVGAPVASSTGFNIVSTASAGRTYSGALTLTRGDGNTWYATWNLGDSVGATAAWGGAYKSLSGTLTGFRLTTASGDTFDNGAWGAVYW